MIINSWAFSVNGLLLSPVSELDFGTFSHLLEMDCISQPGQPDWGRELLGSQEQIKERTVLSVSVRLLYKPWSNTEIKPPSMLNGFCGGFLFIFRS